MSLNKRLLLLPGDGIGPEVMAQVVKIIDWIAKRRSLTFDISEKETFEISTPPS